MELLLVKECTKNMEVVHRRSCCKIGYIRKQCIVVANDATVKAGALVITAKKNLRARNRHGKPPAYHLFSG
jgi:acetyl-CoA carboxylase carboxyltransferase component